MKFYKYSYLLIFNLILLVFAFIIGFTYNFKDELD